MYGRRHFTRRSSSSSCPELSRAATRQEGELSHGSASLSSTSTRTLSGMTPENDGGSSTSGRSSFTAFSGSFGKAGKRECQRKEARTSDPWRHRMVSHAPRSQFYVDLGGATTPADAHSGSVHEDVGWGSTGMGQEGLGISGQTRTWCEERQQDTPAGAAARPPPSVEPHSSKSKCWGGKVLVLPESVCESTMYKRRAAAQSVAARGAMDLEESLPEPAADIINTHTVPAAVSKQFGSVLAQLTHRSVTSLHNVSHARHFEQHFVEDWSPEESQVNVLGLGGDAPPASGESLPGPCTAEKCTCVGRRHRSEWRGGDGNGASPGLTEPDSTSMDPSSGATRRSDAAAGGREDVGQAGAKLLRQDQGQSSCRPSWCGVLARSMSSVVLCDTNPLTLSPDLAPAASPDLTPDTSPDLQLHDKRDGKIFLIAHEVMTSERVFVNVLRLLNVDFRKFILEWREGAEEALPEDDLNKILNFLPQLQDLNEEILQDLEEHITDWERHRKISDVIVRKGPFLKLYSAYIKEFQSQCDHLDHCCHTHPRFLQAVKEFEASERCKKLNLKHYMLKPVQRIPQYRLLLEEYLKRLPEASPDYLDTQTALSVVANVASHANDTMKRGTNFMKLLALQDRLSSSHGSSTGDHDNSNSRRPRYELVRPGRYLLKEGELLKLCRREMQPRYFILLSDVLLYTSFVTSGPGGALRLNSELTLEGMKVETPKAEDFKNEFSVISTSRSFTLQASTAEERDAWIKALREAIEDNASRRSSFLQAKMPNFQQPSTSTLGKQAPVWIPDYRVTMCQQCTAEFTLTFRRHHCRACGKVVCDHCSANRAPLQYKKNQVARVCDNCFEILQKDFENRYEGSVILEDQQGPRMKRVSSLKAQFKKGIRDSNRYRTRKRVPERLMEVCASDTSSQMCGYLRMLVRRSWHRGWFVLKDRVLYEYRAPQDVCALQSLPVLGYQVETMQEVRELADGVDDCLAFQLNHPNQQPLVFHADSPHLAEKWIQAMKEAVVLT